MDLVMLATRQCSTVELFHRGVQSLIDSKDRRKIDRARQAQRIPRISERTGIPLRPVDQKKLRSVSSMAGD